MRFEKDQVFLDEDEEDVLGVVSPVSVSYLTAELPILKRNLDDEHSDIVKVNQPDNDELNDQDREFYTRAEINVQSAITVVDKMTGELTVHQAEVFLQGQN
jgi:hypothetical protein